MSKEIILLLSGIIIGRYFIDLLDNLLALINNKISIKTQNDTNIYTLRTQEIQNDIEDLNKEIPITSQNIGFQVNNEEYYKDYDNEEDE